MNGGLGQVLNDIFQIFGVELPPWGGLALALFIGALIFPFYLQGQKMVRARKIFMKSGFEDYEKRRAMELEALSLVRSSPGYTLSLAQQAFESGRFPFAHELLNLLPKKRSKVQREARILRKKMNPKEDETLAFALIAVDRLIEEELYEAALTRCLKIDEKWPNNREVLIKKEEIHKKESEMNK